MAFDPISSALDLATSVVDRIWPDATSKLKAKAALAELASSGELKKMALQAGLVEGQLKINANEAASTNLFVSGWRPFVGWVCGLAFAWAFVLEPVTATILTAVGSVVVLPVLNLTAMMPVLLGMLGLGGMRSFEKSKKVEGRHG